MRRALLWGLCFISIVSGCAPAETPIPQNDKLTEVMARGTLVIATDANYPPQSRLLPDSVPATQTQCSPAQYTASQMEGFDIEVAVKIADALGVEPCFVTPPWSQLVAGNWGDNWDIHVGSVAITSERAQNLYFTQPYYATPTVVLVHADNTTFHIPEDLSGKRIGICVGCTFEDYLAGTLQLPGEKIEFRIRNAQVIGYENEEPAIADLAVGDGTRLDAVLTLLPVAEQAIASGKPLKILASPLMFAYAGITLDRASRRDVMRLLNKISGIITTFHQDGTLHQLSIHYLHSDLTSMAAQYHLSNLPQKP